MERLTKRITENLIELSAKANPIQFVNSPQRVHLKHPFWNVFDKLAHYEDLEEQGLLLKLPCKTGDEVLCLEEFEGWFDYAKYVFISMCGEYCIVARQSIYCDNIEKQLKEMANDCENWGYSDVMIIHKSRVFRTKEEAEAKLKEMAGES